MLQTLKLTTTKQWARILHHIPQPRNILKYQIILKANTSLIIYCLEKTKEILYEMGFFWWLLLQTQEGGFFSRWASLDFVQLAPFEVLQYFIYQGQFLVVRSSRFAWSVLKGSTVSIENGMSDWPCLRIRGFRSVLVIRSARGRKNTICLQTLWFLINSGRDQLTRQKKKPVHSKKGWNLPWPVLQYQSWLPNSTKWCKSNTSDTCT